MGNGAKATLAFIAGAAAGAAVVAYLNRDKLDLEKYKPLAKDLLDKGIDLKEALLAKIDTLKEELEKAGPKQNEPGAPLAPESAPSQPEAQA